MNRTAGGVSLLQRVRVRFGRKGPAASTSHLQQIDIIRRALRDAAWPVVGSDAKKPKLKVSFGPAISVGYESDAEYCDVDLASRMDIKKSGEALAARLPEGFTLLNVKSIPRFFPSLEESLNAGAYEVESERLADAQPAWDAFWAKEQFLVTKKKADRDVVIDARPIVRSWSLSGDGKLELVIRFGPGRTLKPEKIAQAVCGWPETPLVEGQLMPGVKVRRKQMYLEKSNGDLVEP